MNRRSFLASGGLGMIAAASAPSRSNAASKATGGSVDLDALGLEPNTGTDISQPFQAAIDMAALQGKRVQLPAGEFRIANIDLPDRLTLSGIPGLTRLVFAGGGHFLACRKSRQLWLSGIELDGLVRELPDEADALLFVSDCLQLRVEDCLFTNSAEKAIHVEGSAGIVQSCHVERAMGRCGIMGLENLGMTFRGNSVTDCDNNGILVHRWKKGEDRTIVESNTIRSITASFGGTGEWGNGINVFRAGSVRVSGNTISDCALSAIRSNSGDNVQIVNNQCLRSGEVAIFSEFEFDGALISGNMIDGASSGISIANFDRGGRLSVCSGNLIRNVTNNIPYDPQSDGGGIGIYAEADTSISGNVIENARRIGIGLGWGPYLRDVVAANNVVRQAPIGLNVSVVDGVGAAMITDNLFSDCERAILGSRWYERVTGDLLGGESNPYPRLTVSGNRLG